jgi:predicted metal-dependent HD superfamily phosphohydrolase
VISPERLAELQAGWVQLLADCSADLSSAGLVLERLVAVHTEPQRFYHNLEHLSEMFATADRLRAMAADIKSVRLAIWFHDSVYDSKTKDNEARSAARVAEWMRPLGVMDDFLEHVQAMILATAHTDSAKVDADTAVLLDADLAILSAHESRYARYAADVRREYSWVDNPTYAAGRSRVLAAFLARPRIYRTEPMRPSADAEARQNLRNEIEHLRLLATSEPHSQELAEYDSRQ